MPELQADQSLARHRRALMVAGVGLLVTLIVMATLFICAAQVPDAAVAAAAWIALVLGCSWLYPLLDLYLEIRVDREAIDIEYLRKQSSKQSLFDGAAHDEFSAAARLRFVRHWLVPLFAFAIALLALALTLAFAGDLGDEAATLPNALIITGFIQAFVGFILFVAARFTAGLATQVGYGVLRSPAGLMMLTAAAALLSAVARVGVYQEWPLGSAIVHYLCFVALALYGVETLAGIVVHIYSTKKGDRRPPQDSRLLFMLASPGRAAKSIGEVLDYQFGFEISKSTLYRGFEKGVAPFLIVQLLILWLCSSITVIDAGSVGFVERFGKRVDTVTLQPGLHFTLPWPIDSVRYLNVGELHALQLGLMDKNQKIRIWTSEHGQAEESMVVASAESSGDEVPVNLLATSFAVIYKIDPAKATVWAYDYADAKGLFESRAKAALTRYLTTVDFFKVMGEGRSRESQRLTATLDEIARSMGIDLAYTGFVGVHPPVAVAESYEAVVKAAEAKEARLLQAESVEKRVSAASRYDAAVIKLRAEGEAAEIVAAAKGDAQRFASQLAGYREAPELYKTRRRLEMLRDATAENRKYIVPAGKARVDILNLEEKLRADITDLDLEDLAE